MTRKKSSTIENVKFSERLKQILSETNTTHQELADILGVQRQTVSLYTNRQIRPDIITPELEHRKSGYVERKRRPYQGNVVRIA